MHDYNPEAHEFYRRPDPVFTDRHPLLTAFAIVLLLGMLVGAAFLAGERSGYALGQFDAQYGVQVSQ